ncbi:MAG: MMPL family transporter [Pseudomonadota bacterium]
MFDRLAFRLYDHAAGRRFRVLSALVFLTVISISISFFVEYESKIDLVLPKDPVIARNLDFFRDSNLAGRIAISFTLRSPDRNTSDLVQAVDRMAGSLDRKLLPEIEAGPSESTMTQVMTGLGRGLPCTLAKDDLAQIDARLNKDHVARRLAEIYRQMIGPQGLFLQAAIRSDPLGLGLLTMERMKKLACSIGYDVQIVDGHFISKDGRHALLIMKPSVPVTDTAGARKLLAHLQEVMKGLPAYVSADIICGHVHALSNEDLLKRDIRLISIVATIALLLLYGSLIRDINAVLIFLTPIIGILFSIPLSYLLCGRLAYSVVGFGSVIAGISIDYGTHIYFAARGRKDPDSAVKSIIRPVAFGAFTTIGVFISFFFGRIEAYSQMAVFSIISILVTLAVSVFVLPHFFAKAKGLSRNNKSDFADRVGRVLEKSNLSSWPGVTAWALITLLFACVIPDLRFENDIKKIDGVGREIIERENQFYKTWGERHPAVIVAEAKSYDEALELNERIYADAGQAVGKENIAGLAALVPSEKTRDSNFQNWKDFWAGGREKKLRALFATEGRRYGFSQNAFEPFLAGLYTSPTPLDLKALGLEDKFVQKTKDGYRILSFFPDTEKNLRSVQEITRKYPGAYLVSQTLLSGAISKALSRDIKPMIWVSTTLVVLLTFVCFFNIRETIIALVPPITSTIWLLGSMPLLGLSLNVANMVAAVVVTGIASDYGIFMAFRRDRRTDYRAMLAVSLCAITTLIGAGVLLFAKHPALYSVGITMVIGICAGFLSSVAVVPKLCDSLKKKQKKS